MGGLDPPTQPASVRALNYVDTISYRVIRRADARRLDGRVTPGHGGNLGFAFNGVLQIRTRAPIFR
jgi:hypothetical protein